MAEKRHCDYCDQVIKDSGELRVRTPNNKAYAYVTITRPETEYIESALVFDVCKTCLKRLVEEMY